jgi:hypothetical protein
MKLVILDRDGVINYDSDKFIKHADEWRPIPGSLEAIARLTQSAGASSLQHKSVRDPVGASRHGKPPTRSTRRCTAP